VPTSPAIATHPQRDRIRLTEIPIRPDRPDRALKGGPPHDIRIDAILTMQSSSMNAPHHPRIRAAGTDISERRRSGVSRGPLIIFQRGRDHRTAWDRMGVAIGRSPPSPRSQPTPASRKPILGLAAAALVRHPANRHLATLGGNLAQRSRCWTTASPNIACLRKGGADCPRDQAIISTASLRSRPPAWRASSTMAAALLAYEATIVTDRRAADDRRLVG